jgi:hypothetical protein
MFLLVVATYFLLSPQLERKAGKPLEELSATGDVSSAP